MVELIKFELIKIFKNKGIYIAALAIFILITGSKAIRCISFKSSLGTKEEVQEIAENYMSDSYTKNDIEELWRKSYDTEELSKEKYFLNVYCGCFRKNDGNEIADKLQSINNDIKELEDMGKTEEFRYKSLILL